jgi:hypothetical protein
MNHSFNVNAASYFGVDAAIILNNLCFWCDKNRANGKNFHDNHYWTFNSVNAFSKLFPYLSSKKIRNALNKLEREGLIMSGRYNRKAYDRTKWYSVTQKGYQANNGAIFPNGQMDLPSEANALCQKGEPIPDVNSYINADVNHYTITEAAIGVRLFADQLDADKYPACREAISVLKAMKRSGASNLYDGPLTVEEWDKAEAGLQGVIDRGENLQDIMIAAYNDRFRTPTYSQPDSVNLCYFVQGYDESNDGNRLLHMAAAY